MNTISSTIYNICNHSTRHARAHDLPGADNVLEVLQQAGLVGARGLWLHQRDLLHIALNMRTRTHAHVSKIVLTSVEELRGGVSVGTFCRRGILPTPQCATYFLFALTDQK